MDGSFRGQQKAQHIQVELAVELLRGDLLDGPEGVDAGVVDEDVEPPVCPRNLRVDARDVLRLREVALDRRHIAAGGDYVGDDLVGVRLAGGVVDDDRRPRERQVFGDRRADALGRAGDERGLVGEIAHGIDPSAAAFFERSHRIPH
jgi:hypothetical protein